MLDCVYVTRHSIYSRSRYYNLMTCPNNLLPVCNSAYIEEWVRTNCHTAIFNRATQINSPPKFVKNIHIYKHVDLIKAENKTF